MRQKRKGLVSLTTVVSRVSSPVTFTHSHKHRDTRQSHAIGLKRTGDDDEMSMTLKIFFSLPSFLSFFNSCLKRSPIPLFFNSSSNTTTTRNPGGRDASSETKKSMKVLVLMLLQCELLTAVVNE